MFLWIWLAAIIGALALYLRKAYSRFSKYGVRHFTPVPVLGNMAGMIFRYRSLTDEFDDIMKAFPNDRFIGRYAFTMPVVLIQDLELIKNIFIKDFDHFIDHQAFVDENVDPLFGRSLFSLKGQEWKDMRSTLSPAFTSFKIRHMVPFMVEVGNMMVKNLEKKIQNSEVNYIDVEGKDLSTRYANDVIATCAFGLSVNSHSDEENQFFTKGKEIMNFKFRKMLVLFLIIIFPKLNKVLNMSLFSKDFNAFFENIVLNTMRDREEKNIIRPDMIHLLIELKKGRLTHENKTSDDHDAGFATVEESYVGTTKTNRVWSDIDLVAQAALFFLAGFETSSSAMAFALHEMAVNPEVQERLAKEIGENEERNGGKFDYNSVQKMTYMDMVVSEVLRMWPPVVAVGRECAKDYNLGRANKEASQDFIIRKGETLNIATWIHHRNPKHFPNPLKFDPERFSEENKRNIKPLTYMPFGLGPRNCIGSRFALCEVKVMLYMLLKNLEVSPCPKTKIPVVLNIENFNLKIEGGHVRFTMRK